MTRRALPPLSASALPLSLSLAIAIAIAFAPLVARAHTSGPKARTVGAVRTTEAPSIDGKLDDPVWGGAPQDDRFFQIIPEEGAAPTERTSVRVLYDDAHIYVAVRCDDKDASKLEPRLTRRDRDIETDWIAVAIDSRHDHASAFVFQLSLAGVQVDGQFFNDNEFTYDWDAVWYGKTSLDAGGWSAEFAIPLTVLRFSGSSLQEWGLQVHRNISRKREWTMWSFTPLSQQAVVSQLGHIEGMRGLKPRRTFELRPYMVARVGASTTEGGALLGLQKHAEFEPSWDVGLDLKLGLTSRLTLDATVNPDFGQVEVDQVVLNLSRFETFFPEKRPFFLEGTDLFATPYTMFYPRRIGRTSTSFGAGDTIYDANDAPLLVTDAEGALRIWSAAKVTGNVDDAMSIGLIGAVTGAEIVDAVDDDGIARSVELAPERSWVVARVKYALGRGAYLGLVGTAVNRLGGELYRASANHDAYTQGLDAWWQSHDGRWRLSGQIVASERVGGTSHRDGAGRPCPEGEAAGCIPIARADGTRLEPGDVGLGATAHLGYSSRKAFVRAMYRTNSPKLDLNALGFQPVFNSHRAELIVGYTDREPGKTFHQVNLIPLAFAQMNYDGVPQELIVGMDTELKFRNFTFTSPQLLFLLPGTYDTFETFDGARFAKTAKVDFNWVVQSNQSKAFWASGRVLAHHDLGGDGWSVGFVGSVNWQARSNLELSLEPEIGHDENAVRFYGCSTGSSRPCLVEPGARRYTFADLDSSFLSTTFRGTFTLSTALSLQAYAQLFLARGDFSDYRSVETQGERPTIERGDLQPIDLGDLDDGFEEAALNVNLVTRWEPVPGTTLFLVYTRAQSATTVRLRDLDTGPAEDIVLVKLVYFAS